MTTLISQIITERMERGLSDLLLTVADHFYCRGARIPSEAATHPGLADLLQTLERRYETEIMALRGWSDDDPALLRDERLGWLLSLPQQANTETAPLKRQA